MAVRYIFYTFIISTLLFSVSYARAEETQSDPIRIGAIYSETGSLMTNEQPLIAAMRVAVEEINSHGGILNRRLEIIFRDGQSNPETAALAAEELIQDDNVSAIFGCWSSACRKAVMQVVQKEEVPFYYPVQYEGRGAGELPLDPSPNIFYAGAAPNQQIVPVLDWILSDYQAPKIFLIGSDYVYPRSANAFIKRMLEGTDAQIVEEKYFDLGNADFSGLSEYLEEMRPDVILNTVNGNDNIALFDEIARFDRDGRRTRTVSFSIDENQLRDIGEANFVGRFAVWNYFHNTQSPSVSQFMARFRYFGGADNWLSSDPVEASYLLVHLFADSARRSGALDIISLRRGSRNIVLQGLSGPLFVDAQTQHLWKPAEVSRYGAMRKFEPVWRSNLLIEPVPILENMPGQFSRVLQYPVANRQVAFQMIRSANANDRLRGYRWLQSNQIALSRDGLLDPATFSLTISEQMAIVNLLALQDDSAFITSFSWLLERLNERERKTSVALALFRFSKIEIDDVDTLRAHVNQMIEFETDVFWQRNLMIALSHLHRDEDESFGLAFEKLSLGEPSVFIQATKNTNKIAINDNAFYRSLTKMANRPDFALTPGMKDFYCETIGSQLTLNISIGNDVPNGLANSIKSNTELIRKNCASVLSTYQRVSNSFLTTLTERLTPNSPQGWVLTILSLALFPLILWNFFTGLALWIFPSWAIQKLRPFRELPQWIPSFFHYIFGLVPTIGLRQKALDSWVSSNRLVFASNEKDNFYQDLVVELRSDGVKSIAIADTKLIKTSLRVNNPDELVRLAILGEGGVGKSTISHAILRVIAEDEDSKRIGVFIEAEKIKNLDNINDVREAIRIECAKKLSIARKSSRGTPCEFENEKFLNALLSSGRLVVIFDDLSRALDDKWNLYRDPSFENNFGAIIYTGRFSVGSFATEIIPQPLDRVRLSAFVESNLAASNLELSTKQSHLLDESLDRIFSARREVPALFAALIAQHFMTAPKDVVLTEVITIPYLVLSYVEGHFKEVNASELFGVQPEDYWRIVGALAWACISRGLRVINISVDNAEKAITQYVRDGDAPAVIEFLYSKTSLIHLVQGNRIVLASDALAEYLAACWLFARQADGRWARNKREISDQISLTRVDGTPPDYMRTFLQAIRDVAESGDVNSTGIMAKRISSSREALRELDNWIALWSSELDTIKVGILHSQTGVMAISERPLIAAAKLAIERINNRGGISGRMIEPVLKDGASDENVFAKMAEEFIDEGIVFIFGCWTSASRIEVLRVLDQTSGLLFYPVQYEGYENNENALYFGASPNQQIIPAIKWCMQSPLNTKKFMSIGSDYIFPRVANEVISATFKTIGEAEGSLVCEPLYVPLNDYSLDEVIQKIEKYKPEVILNLLNGSANLNFFWKLFSISKDGYTPKVMSFSIGDHEVQRIGAEVMEGHYSCWSYFCSLDNIENTTFLRGMRNSDVFFPSDPAEAAYTQMHVFAEAAEKVMAEKRALSADAVREACIGAEYRSPAGTYKVLENGHVAKTPRIGVLGSGSSYHEVWSAEDRVDPNPFPYENCSEKIALIRKRLHNI